ncbi:MAG: fructosamine kinase family protein, partial [Anaerolineales bacterium]|nr:fructosamine kinase family protein [Anaerolineales bacterium]
MPSKILLETISHLLANKANDTTPILQTRRVSGGDINAAARLSTKKAEYFIKWNPRPLPGMFLAEARGLAELEKGGELRVPHVFAHAEVKNDVPAFILMEWLGGNASKISPSLSENLGRGLAALHRRTQPKYGWRYDNYIGALPQSNTESTDWIAFYREKRLGVQLELAAKSNRLPSYRRRQLERLMANLDRWIDPAA